MELNKSIEQIWLNMASAVCEGVAARRFFNTSETNIWGRKVFADPSGQVQYCMGVSSSGLRASAFAGDKLLSRNVQSLRSAVRNLQPLVLVAPYPEGLEFLQTGAFVFFADSPQEFIDLYIIAHHVAERSLIPGVVLVGEAVTHGIPEIPLNGQLAAFLGEPNDLIPCPTEAQKILFGAVRRRIPRLFNHDIPVTIAAGTSAKGATMEQAAHAAYFAAPLDALISNSFSTFDAQFGRRYESIRIAHLGKSGSLVLSPDRRVFDLVKSSDVKPTPVAVLLRQLSPVSSDLLQVTSRVDAVLLIEQARPVIFNQMAEAMASAKISLYSSLYGEQVSGDSLKELLNRFAAGELSSDPLWLDFQFIFPQSAFPKKQVLMQELQRLYPGLAGRALAPGPVSPVRMPLRIPLALRSYKDKGPAYSRLSNFFDQTSFFYDTDSPEWTADPFMAMPVMPPATAEFGMGTANREKLPLLDAGACTACGDCFVHCPHGALPPLAIDLESLVKSGIQRAQAAGHIISQLFPQVRKLVKVTEKVLEDLQKEPGASHLLSEALERGFEDFARSAGLEGEKLSVAKSEFQHILNQIGAFNTVLSRSLYNDSGKYLFTMGVSLNACTGCGVCAAVCSDQAIKMETETPDLTSLLEQRYSVWEQLPDTAAGIIENLFQQKDYNPLAAMMLSRNYYMGINGAGTHGDDPVKAGLRTVAAAAEIAIQKNYGQIIRTIDEYVEKVEASIRKELSLALPEVSGNGISKTLEAIENSRFSMDEMLSHYHTHAKSKLLDKESLKRKSDLLKELSVLKDQLGSGSTGLGRSRYGVIIDGSLKHLAEFPSNIFTTPALCLDDTHAAVKGLLLGQMRHAVDQAKILQRAALESANSYNPGIHDLQIAALQWDELAETEKKLLPPLLVIARKSLLQSDGIGELTQLLAEELPIKLVLFDDALPHSSTSFADVVQNNAVLWPLLALQNPDILQSSLSEPEHLFEGLSGCFGKMGSAVISLFAPQTSHGNTRLFYEMALQTRAFVHFDFRMSRRSEFVLPRMNVRHNPSPDQIWVESAIQYRSSHGEEQMRYVMTYADWLYIHPEFKTFFTPCEEQGAGNILVADYLLLPADGRKGKNPVIIRLGSSGELVYYSVHEYVVAATESCAKAWNTLRELAGETSEFPENMQKRLEARISEGFEVEKEEIRKEYERRLAGFEQEFMERIRRQIREKLIALAGVKK